MLYLKPVTIFLISLLLDVKVAHFEMLLIRLLHLLAHHPDFGTDESQLKEQAK